MATRRRRARRGRRPVRAGELTQQHGYFHAGATAAIADSAGGYAAFTLFPENTSVLTVEYKTGLVAHGVSVADAHRISSLPPVATLFASFLGYNPMATLLGAHSLHALPIGQAQQITGRSFFPQLISGPLHTALVYAFVFAIHPRAHPRPGDPRCRRLYPTPTGS